MLAERLPLAMRCEIVIVASESAGNTVDHQRRRHIAPDFF